MNSDHVIPSAPSIDDLRLDAMRACLAYLTQKNQAEAFVLINAALGLVRPETLNNHHHANLMALGFNVGPDGGFEPLVTDTVLELLRQSKIRVNPGKAEAVENVMELISLLDQLKQAASGAGVPVTTQKASQ